MQKIFIGFFGILLSESIVKYKDEIVEKLRKKGVGTRPYFWPLHIQPVLRKFKLKIDDSACPNSKYLATRGFYLPSGLGMEIEEVEEISNIFKTILKEY